MTINLIRVNTELCNKVRVLYPENFMKIYPSIIKMVVNIMPKMLGVQHFLRDIKKCSMLIHLLHTNIGIISAVSWSFLRS